MTELFDEIECVLADLLQSGMDTGAAFTAQRLVSLTDRCEDLGLHTGSAILTELRKTLEARSHQLEKENVSAAAAVCRMTRYVGLCRERLQEEAISDRWAWEE